MSLTPGTQLGPYRLLRKLGEGGMAVVHLAEHVPTGAFRALKLLALQTADEVLIERFEREARAQAQVDQHPHVGRVHDVGFSGGYLYLAADYLPGGSLEQRLRSGPLDPLEAAGYVRDLARALEHTHAHGILHRDLKPDNVLFDEGGKVRLVDFGLARITAEPKLTETGMFMGTPSYVAPELLLGKAPTEQVDVYGLGALLYALVSGRPVFSSDSVIQTLNLVLDTPPDPLPTNVPPRLARICARALSKDPARRQAGAGELARDLDAFLENPSSTRAPSPLALSLLLLGLALILSLSAWITPASAPPSPLASPSASPSLPPPPLSAVAGPSSAAGALAKLTPLLGQLRQGKSGARGPTPAEARGWRRLLCEEGLGRVDGSFTLRLQALKRLNAIAPLTGRDDDAERAFVGSVLGWAVAQETSGPTETLGPAVLTRLQALGETRLPAPLWPALNLMHVVYAAGRYLTTADRPVELLRVALQLDVIDFPPNYLTGPGLAAALERSPQDPHLLLVRELAAKGPPSKRRVLVIARDLRFGPRTRSFVIAQHLYELGSLDPALVSLALELHPGNSMLHVLRANRAVRDERFDRAQINAWLDLAVADLRREGLLGRFVSSHRSRVFRLAQLRVDCDARLKSEIDVEARVDEFRAYAEDGALRESIEQRKRYHGR